MKNKASNKKPIVILLVLILMLMMGLIYVNNLNGSGGVSSKPVENMALAGQIEAADKNSILCSFDDMLAEANGMVVKVRAAEGEGLWSKSFPGKITKLRSEAAKLYIMDSTKKLYCMSKGGKLLWDKQLEGSIKELYVDEDGSLLIDMTSDGGNKLQILGSDGMDKGIMGLEKAEVIAFAAGKTENSIVILDLSAEIIKTKIITLNQKGEMIWSDNFDNQIIAMIGYSKDNTLWAVGEKTLYRYKGADKQQSKTELNTAIHRARIAESGAALAVRARSGYEMLFFDENLKQIGKKELEKLPNGINSGESNYILYYDEKLVLTDQRGSIKSEYKSIPTINRAYFTTDGNVVMVSDRLIQKISK